jgi:hypothetical protein
MGGRFAKRKDHPIKVSRLWSDEPNRYQEPKGFKIHGVEAGTVTVLTRLHKWTIKTVPVNESNNNQWKPNAIEYEQGVFEKIRASGP